MANITCPNCSKAKMESIVVPDLEKKFEGVTIRVKDARISRCPNCKKESYSARELQRWKEIKRSLIESAGQIPSPEDVKRIRTALGLSVSDFAILLGVTRQTVHAWEKPGTPPMSFGPSALLILLLDAEAKRGVSDVFSQLVAYAHGRGQLEKIGTDESSIAASFTAPQRVTCLTVEPPVGSTRLSFPPVWAAPQRVAPADE